MSNSSKLLAQNIKAELRRIERRPAWLSDKSGVSKGQISRILKGKANPTLETVDQLSKSLGIPSHQLISSGVV